MDGMAIFGSNGDEHLEIADSALVRTLAPPHLRAAIDRLPADAFLNDPLEIERRARPTLCLRKIKAALWEECAQALASRRRLKIANIYRGICSKSFLNKNVITDSVKLTWLLLPPSDALTRSNLRTALEMCIDRMAEILKAPVLDGNGNIKPANAKAVLETFALVNELLGPRGMG